jgi:hypothetical protein
MAIRFDAIDEALDLEGITLPIGGKDYLIPPPNALTGLEVTRLMSLVVDATNGADITDDPRVAEVLDANEKAGESFEKRILGPALDEMMTDGVPWPMVQLAFQTTMIWISQGAETAARYWTAGGGATGKEPNRQTRRATRKARPVSTASRKPANRK